jgi:hypothetical protein
VFLKNEGSIQKLYNDIRKQVRYFRPRDFCFVNQSLKEIDDDGTLLAQLKGIKRKAILNLRVVPHDPLFTESWISENAKASVKILDRDYYIVGNGMLIHPLLVLTSIEVINNVSTR